MIGALLALAVALVPSLAWAQGAVLQNGSIIQFDLPGWVQDKTIMSGGKMFTDNFRGFNASHFFDNRGLGVCTEDALTSGPYSSVCIGHDATGGGLITINSYNGATQQGLNFNINGSIYPFPGSGGGNVSGPNSSLMNEIVAFNGTSGTLVKQSGLITSPVCDIAVGGANCRSNLTISRDESVAGVSGNTYSAIYATTTTHGAGPHFEWTGLFIMDNNATAGENVATYAQSKKNAGAGPTFGSVIEIQDTSLLANPTSGQVAMEIDLQASGTDNLGQRVMGDYWVKNQPSGANATAAYGIRFNTETGANLQVALSCAGATVSIACLRMTDNQRITFGLTDAFLYYATGVGFVYDHGGAHQTTVADNGAFALNRSLQVGSPTGGDKGIGSINAFAYWANGTAGLSGNLVASGTCTLGLSGGIIIAKTGC